MDAIISCFQHKSYKILYAPNGELGYQIAKKELPDLIIMDWAMPVLNGIDATLKLKAKKATKWIPIVMATGVMTDPEDLKEALEAGAVDYIRKPFDPLELTSRVHAALVLSQSFREIFEQKREIEELFQKEKVLLQEQLDHKERSLGIQALHAQEKVNIFKEINYELKKLGRELDLSGVKTFNKLLKKTAAASQDHEHNSNFLFHFENVHPRFIERLQHRLSGDLTSNEQKLCAYIKVGMSNKEIAHMAGVELGTVKSNINRLKKKFGLSGDTNIRTFMNNVN